MYYTKFNTKYFEIVLIGDENGLQRLYANINNDFNPDKDWVLNNNLFEDVKEQIIEFFEGKRQTFNVKINMKGTDFQKKVWTELLKIPYGQLYTYKEIATNVGNEKASRAVGMANRNNPIPIIIPCHRVVGSNGNLTGFALGLDIKEILINIEKRYKFN